MNNLASYDDLEANKRCLCWRPATTLCVGLMSKLPRSRAPSLCRRLWVLLQLEEVCARWYSLSAWSTRTGQVAYEPVPQATCSLKDRIVGEYVPGDSLSLGDKASNSGRGRRPGLYGGL